MAGKRKLEDLSLDEFLQSGFDSDDDETKDEPTKQNGLKINNKKQLKQDELNPAKASHHKEQLSRLKDKDPEFYQFLQENDQNLLNFDDSDSSDDEDKFHQPPTTLEEASDAEDEDDEPLTGSKKSKTADRSIKVTEKMIQGWKESLKKQCSMRLIRDITQAFKAAVATTKGEGDIQCRYVVADSSAFNSLVLFCIRNIHGAFQRMLELKPNKNQKKLVLPQTSKKWQKMQTDIKMYLSGVVQLLSCLTERTVISAVLRHANTLAPYFLCLPQPCRHLVKQLMKQWSTGEETCRVFAFLTLNKICRHKQETYLAPILKQMYIAYVKNCKFTSPNALPMINFMQRTLTEMYALDTQTTYQQAFIYIRQLAIHLRNAMTMKKKETYQSVYNWQYIHCLGLWCRVLSTLHPSEVLQPLIYPLCQVIIGTIKLVPTARYYPLRMHCCRALTLLSSSTNTFVPVLPFLAEVLEQVDFNKKPGRISNKPINFAVILKLNKINLMEKAYKDGLIDQLYDLMLEHFQTQSSSIGFPELALPTVIQLKAFLKECKVANYCKPIRQLLEKVQENGDYITAKRLSVTFGVADTNAVVAWENVIQKEGTPLSKFYSQWKKLREKEIQLEISGKERMEDLDLPEIKRKKLQEKKAEDKKEFKGLFESDSDDDDDDIGIKIKGKKTNQGSDDEDDDDDDDDDDDGEGLSDMSDGDLDEEDEAPSKAPQPFLASSLKKIAEGDEDVVEDLELSDDDDD